MLNAEGMLNVMTVDPIACGVFLLLAFTLAGLAQTAWFASPASRAFALPLDGGVRFRGRRLFGANKTIRGFRGDGTGSGGRLCAPWRGRAC